MKTYLNVDYSEKNEAKKLGARWDGENKKWYSENPSEELLAQFGFGKLDGKQYNTQLWSRIEIQCEQHCENFTEYKRSFESKYNVLKYEDLKTPLFHTLQESINYWLENGIIEEKTEATEPVYTEKELIHVWKAFVYDNNLKKNPFSMEERLQMKQAFDNKSMKELKAVLNTFNHEV